MDLMELAAGSRNVTDQVGAVLLLDRRADPAAVRDAFLTRWCSRPTSVSADGTVARSAVLLCLGNPAAAGAAAAVGCKPPSTNCCPDDRCWKFTITFVADPEAYLNLDVLADTLWAELAPLRAHGRSSPTAKERSCRDHGQDRRDDGARRTRAGEPCAIGAQLATMALAVRWTQCFVDADMDRWLPATDPDCRDLVLSCGAALHHLRVALASLDIRNVVHRIPNPATRPRGRLGPTVPAAGSPGRCREA